jgi:hypothetical protein
MNRYAIYFNGEIVFHVIASGQVTAVHTAMDTPEYKAAVKRLKGKETLLVSAILVSKAVH